jgi:uncharacterized protein (DUF2249 family)
MPSDTDVHAAETTIDVRTIPPWERHALIFRTFDELPSGGTLQLVNDHDPAPLRTQFESRHPGTFRWDYAESGPDVWRVRIGKTESVCCGGCH